MSHDSSRAKRAAAAAGLLCVGVVEHEPFREERRVVVEHRSVQEQIALAIHEDLRAVPFEHLVAEPGFLLPPERVTEAGTAAPLHADTETSLADALLGHHRPDLVGGGLGYLNHFNPESRISNPESQ